MTPEAIVSCGSLLIAALTLFFSIRIASRREDSNSITSQIALKLSQFKDDFIHEIRHEFVERKTLDLELKLIGKTIEGLDHRTARNSSHISMIFRQQGKNRPEEAE